MPKIGNLCSPGGQYQDQNGQTKTRWVRCGALIQTNEGKFVVKLDTVPVNPLPNQDGDAGIWFQCFPDQQPGQQQGGGFRQNAPQQNQNYGQQSQGGQTPAPQPTGNVPPMADDNW